MTVRLRLTAARSTQALTVLVLAVGAWGFVLGVGWMIGVIVQRAGGAL